ncbi:MAG: hypothetical protein A3D31_00055 [Candidatus Fluviicola riflensis]|nr:MAG: hypothetical protein CHH17_05500 [Candidatus Fluviicola riflensis]OGS76004.1 MAG: hypothetical protein A3D31_00055 [Candidatus Fluviicola riflensis]OGS81904.1 MAG: hypothetical protein A2724_15810 [Fluviicola sp. RIFCSPHIGHO2_01_FULL_43_53]OGS83342.1 MAG: hypothetical protein A3E30_18975 [Fluviicola sp. RIFCSPHIGHO2_12_FULL_43_24]
MAIILAGMKILLLLIGAILLQINVQAQFFELKKTYTGSHYAFSRYDPSGLNRFVVGFNEAWRSDLKEGFAQYKGGELGLTFTTSGFRVIFGKREDFKWTASTDYAFGFGKDKNKAEFNNNVEQLMEVRCSKNQINTTFGVALKESKVWLEGYLSTNLARVLIQYTTIYPNGNESYGSEYKLNGLYKGTIKTTELGIQMSYKRKKYVFYTRAMYPIIVLGPNKEERNFVDKQNGHEDPTDFPSNYNYYLNNPSAYVSENGQLKSSDFKGLSFGFGLLYLFGKAK